ncbi:MAG: hypothetical protein IJZ26_00565 [Clostridia bacterium]|nr:hypothetical protein [Clostridia bacterium]
MSNQYNQNPNDTNQQPIQNTQQSINQKPQKVKVKRKGGCLPFFMGMCTALFLLVFCIGGFGLYVYYCVTFEQLSKTLGIQSPLGEEFNNKTVNMLIQDALEVKDNYVHMTLYQADEYGLAIPETIIGISIGNVYDKEVTYNGNTTKVGDIEILDAVNNLDKFVDAVLPAVYETAKIGEILDAISVDITVYDYPAVTDPIYNIGTQQAPVMKTLRELTIQQALDVFPTMYGEETLTLSILQTALGAEYIPNESEYSTLLNTPVTKLKIEDVADDMSVGTLLDLFGEDALGLQDYNFTQTDEFKATKINDLGEYMKTVALNQIIDITPLDQIDNPTAMEKLLASIGEITIGEIMDGGKSSFATVMDTATLGDLISTESGIMPVIKNVTLAEILLESDIIKDYLKAEARTIQELLPNLDYTNALLLPIANITFNTLIENEANAYDNQLNQITLGNLVAGTMNGSSIATTNTKMMSLIHNITLNDLFYNSQTISDALCSSTETFGTIMQLIEPVEESSQLDKDLWTIKDETFTSLKDGYNALNHALKSISISDLTNSDAGIMKVIGSVTLGDIFEDPNSLMNALKSSTTTLGEMLEISSPTGIMEIVAKVSVGKLFNGNANTAIKEAFTEDENLTLKDLLEIEGTTSGIISLVETVKVAGLFGDNPGEALKEAFLSSTKTLGDLLELNNPTGMLKIVAGVKVADLFGDTPSTALKSVFENSTETMGELLEITVDENTSAIMKTIAKIPVGDMFTNPSNVFENLKISDLFPNYESNNILNAIVNKGTTDAPITISNLETTINTLTVEDLFGTSTTGILTLIPSSTTLNNLGSTLDDLKLTEKSLVELETAEIFGDNSPFKNTVFDKDSTDIVDSTNNRNAYEAYVASNNKEPDANLETFINSLTTTTEGQAFLTKFLSGYTY